MKNGTQTRPMKGRTMGNGKALSGFSTAGKQMRPGTLKRLLSYLEDYKIRLIFVIVCILLSSAASVASSLFLQTLIDRYILPLLVAPNPVYTGLLRAILTMGIILLGGVFAGLFYNRTMAVMAQSVLKRVRDDMFEHMQTLPISYFDGKTNGEIMSYYTNDADTLRQMISQSLPQLVASVVSMIAVLASMLHLSIWLSLLVLCFAGIIFWMVKFLAGKSGAYFMGQQKSLADVNGHIEEMIHGQKVVKVFCHERKSAEIFDEKNELLCENATKANTLVNILMPLIGALGYVVYIFIAIVGGWMAIQGIENLSIGGEEVVTLGTIASFLTLSRNFINPIAQVSQQLSSVVMAMAGASRIFEFLDEKPEEDFGTVTLVNADETEDGRLVETKAHTGKWAWKDGEHLIPMHGKLEMKNVDFGYVENVLVLHDITVYAKPGQKVAFVGATGAGKTTITNLINRFYDIDDGKIQYDGININRICKEDLRSSLGVVLQDVHLFTGTVMDNIRYGKLEATDEECIQAAKLANAHSFIKRLPKGYHTMIEGDGGGLSQGQRQLISIARAAVADPPVMILDEATSSIDTRTETIVQRGMDNLMKGRTVFVIAHRLSTIQNADVIMVMEDGRIIERGSHQELMEQKGKYFQLYKGVFELE